MGLIFEEIKFKSLFTYLSDASPYMCSNIFRGSYGYYSYDGSLAIKGYIYNYIFKCIYGDYGIDINTYILIII